MLGAGLLLIHPISLKEVLVYWVFVKVTCITVCNDISPGCRLALNLSKMWPWKQHYQPINDFLDSCLTQEKDCFIVKITLKYPTMICKSQIRLNPICPFRGAKTTTAANMKLRKKCSYLELFWSVFSGIWTDYGEIMSISPVFSSNSEKCGPD